MLFLDDVVKMASHSFVRQVALEDSNLDCRKWAGTLKRGRPKQQWVASAMHHAHRAFGGIAQFREHRPACAKLVFMNKVKEYVKDSYNIL